ncbi:MAG: Tic20 family protein [Microcystaceae cyanobacterium]
MTWRSSVDVKDRIFSVLVYLFAWFDCLGFGRFLFDQFEPLSILALPALPVALLYGILDSLLFGFGRFLVFIILFAGVVRNDRISHFIRFNTIQTILIGILAFLLGLVMNEVLINVFGQTLITETLSNTIFLGGLGACMYSMVQSALGKYAEIPTISEAAYSQVRY